MSGIEEALALSDSEKLDLCMSLLQEFGASLIKKPNAQGEIVHTCVLPFGLHAHGDAHPSASINYKKLVYNCLSGCGHGGLLWFVGTCRGTSGADAKAWLVQKAAPSVDDLPSFLALLDRLYAGSESTFEPIPRYSPNVLAPWRVHHPYMFEVRRIPLANLERFDIGYGVFRVGTLESERIVIPHYWRHDLVGWTTRRIVEDRTPKYLNTTSFPKDQTIFNYDGGSEVTMVMEGQMSVLAHPDEPHAEATFSAEVTDRQVRLLAEHPKVVLFFDNDTAGWRATLKVGEVLVAHTDVWVVQNPYDADPADMGDDYRLLPQVPFSVWEPPTRLEPYVRN